MRISVIGAGALGCLHGVYLAEAGHEVTLIDIRPDIVEAIKRDGLRLDGVRGEHRTTVDSATPDTASGPSDVVILVAHTDGTLAPALMSTASRSRIALLYSARFKRCARGRPGLGAAAAAASRASSSRATSCADSDTSGAGTPTGGISPRVTFRSTFSHTAVSVPTLVGSSSSKDTPAVRRLSLWQPRQYFPINHRAGSSFLCRESARLQRDGKESGETGEKTSPHHGPILHRLFHVGQPA